MHVEVTPEKMEHMCMCARTRWERMQENMGTPEGSCSRKAPWKRGRQRGTVHVTMTGLAWRDVGAGGRFES